MNGNSLSVKGQELSKWKYLNLIDLLLPIYLVYTIPTLYFGLHYDFLIKGFCILTTLGYLIKFGLPKGKNTKVFTAFFILVAFSFIQYMYNGIPITCYISDASNYLAAMLFFYVGETDDRPGRTFYNKMMIFIAIVFAIGLVYYVLTPSWYVARIQEIMNLEAGLDYSESAILERMRYSAFFGDSYNVSHFSVFCSAVALFDIAYTHDRKKIIAIICLIIGLISSIASMHRASMLGSFIAIMVFVYYNHRMHLYNKNVKIVIAMVLFFILFLIVAPRFNERVVDIIGMITERVDDNMNLNKALNERKFTKELINSMTFYIFGHGLGSGGVGVRQYGFPGVSDMQYIKMFFENGIVGAFLFIIVISKALTLGIKRIKYYLSEVAIILFILVAMLGSNSLSMYYFVVFPFWYAVGRIYNKDYYNRLKNNEWTY